MLDTKTRKLTYEQYLESIKEDVYAEKGETVTCTNSHRIMEFNCTVYIDNEILTSDVTNPGEGYVPGMFCQELCKCGATFVNFSPEGIKYGTQVLFWIDGEWRKRKYG